MWFGDLSGKIMLILIQTQHAYFSIPVIFTVLHQLFSDPFLQFPIIPHFAPLIQPSLFSGSFSTSASPKAPMIIFDDYTTQHNIYVIFYKFDTN